MEEVDEQALVYVRKGVSDQLDQLAVQQKHLGNVLEMTRHQLVASVKYTGWLRV